MANSHNGELTDISSGLGRVSWWRVRANDKITSDTMRARYPFRVIIIVQMVVVLLYKTTVISCDADIPVERIGNELP